MKYGTHKKLNGISYLSRLHLNFPFNLLIHSQRSGNLSEFRGMKYKKLHSVRNSMQAEKKESVL